MTRDEAVALLKEGRIDEWNNRRLAGDVPALDGVDLSGVNFQGANLDGVWFKDANLRQASFGGTLAGTLFAGANLENSSFNGATLEGVTLCDANLDHANFCGTTLYLCPFTCATLRHALFVNTKCKQGVSFAGAVLEFANFEGADLQHADFLSANLLGITVSGETKLGGARVQYATITRHTLESLRDYGGLARADREKMRIVDDVADLRRNFSGFKQWFHLLAMAVFAFPYAWFLGTHWVTARFDDVADSVSLGWALLQFIGTGGDWPHGDFAALPVALFGYALSYNVLRAGLLWKTKTLEMHEQITGMSPNFTLAGLWRGLYRAVNVGFYGNIVVVAAHSLHFLSQRIPVPKG